MTEMLPRTSLMKHLLPGILMVSLLAVPVAAEEQQALGKDRPEPLGAVFEVTREMRQNLHQGLPKSPEEPAKKEGLSLSDCIDIALSSHQRLTASYSNLAASLARVEAAQAPYYPSISINGEYNRSHSSVASFRGGDQEFYKVYGSLNQTIFDFGRRGNSLDAVRSAVDAEKGILSKTRQDIVFGVKEAYFQALSAKRVAEANEEALAQTEANLDLAKAHFEAGTKARFDVTKAEVDRQDAKISLVKSRYAHEGAMMTLKNRMFIPYGTPITLSEPAPLLPYEENMDLLVAEAVERRPEVKEMEARLRQLGFDLRAAKSDYFPTVGLNANYGWQDYESGLQEENRAWNIALQFKLPVFEGFVTNAKVSEKQASLNSLRAQMITLKQDIGLEVVKDLLAVKDAEARLALTSEKIRQAREQMHIAQGRYEAGVGILLEATDARVALTRAETEHIQIQNEYYVSRARLDRSVGRQ